MKQSSTKRGKGLVTGTGARDVPPRSGYEASTVCGIFRTTPGRQCCGPGRPALRGFTLVEIMVVVVVIGILAALIIPQFMGTTHDAKVSAAKGNVSELESALERFYVHMDRYPSNEEGLKALVEAPTGEEKKWRGPYVKQIRTDPWGNVFQYRSPGIHHSSSFDVWSRGADGADGGEGQGVDIGNW